MLGYISYTEGRKRGEVLPRTICGQRFLEAALPKGRRWLGALEAGRLAKALGRRGVRQAVFPVDFPWGEAFARRGILPVDILPLHRAMAALVVRQRMGELGISPSSATVAVAAERMDGVLERVLTDLALHNRYLVLQIPAGADRFCAAMRREYGVSVLRTPTRRQMEQADALLLFSPVEGLESRSPIQLRLYDGERVLRQNGVRFALPAKLGEEVEENCGAEQLLAVLLGAGILQNHQIPIQTVDSGQKSYYNAYTV